MVHNLSLFPYHSQLSHIQKNLQACPFAICGQNLELCSVPAIFHAIYIYLLTGSLKGFRSGRLSSLQDRLADLQYLAQVYLETGKAGGVYLIKYESFFFADTFLLRRHEKVSSTHTKKMLPDLIFHWKPSVFLIFIFEICRIKMFLSFQKLYSII